MCSMPLVLPKMIKRFSMLPSAEVSIAGVIEANYITKIHVSPWRLSAFRVMRATSLTRNICYRFFLFYSFFVESSLLSVEQTG